MPFGAFSHLVDVADIGKPAALLRAARQSLRADDDDVLIVDDANQLDPLSATLVYQLALAGETKMIVTARADTAPQAIRGVVGRRPASAASTSEQLPLQPIPRRCDEFLDGVAGRRRARCSTCWPFRSRSRSPTWYA